MNPRVKMKAIVLYAGVILMCFSWLDGVDRPYQPVKEEFPARLMHFLFLSDSNLVDGRLLLEMKEKIGLTPEQEEKIEDLVLKEEAFNIRASAEIKIKEFRFAAYLRSGKLDRKEMETHIRKISSGKTNLLLHYLNYLLDVRAVLTPRQVKILQQMKGKRNALIRRNLHAPAGHYRH